MQHWTNLVKHHWWCMQNPGALDYANSLLYGLPQTTVCNECKTAETACLSYEKIRPDQSSAAAFAPVTGLCALDVHGACVCFLGDAWPSTVLSRGTTDTTSTKLAAEICIFAAIDSICFTDDHLRWLPLQQPICGMDCWTVSGMADKPQFRTLLMRCQFCDVIMWTLIRCIYPHVMHFISCSYHHY